jgi:hypothetical protein
LFEHVSGITGDVNIQKYLFLFNTGCLRYLKEGVVLSLAAKGCGTAPVISGNSALFDCRVAAFIQPTMDQRIQFNGLLLDEQPLRV